MAVVIRAMTWYPMTFGRSVKEMLRMIAALRRTATDDLITPESWRPGGERLLRPLQSAGSLALDAMPADWFHQTRNDE